MESVYVLTLLLAVCVPSSVRGQPKCTPKEGNPCICEGSNFTLNLGAAFQYPYPTSQNISIGSDDPDGPTSFVISPCVDIDCGGGKARACQYDVKNNVFVVLGTASSVAWDVTDEKDYVVTFGGGDATFDGKQRQAVFTGVVKDDVKEPTFTFDGDDMQETTVDYQFTVTYNSSKQCTLSNDKCSCVCNNFTINLGAAFQSPTYQNISDADDPDGSFSFVISPCVDIDCGGKKARACEYDVSNDVFVVLGTAASVIWSVTDQNNYVVTYQGGDRNWENKQRAASITGLVGDIRTPSYTYDGEDLSDTQLIYKFMVMYNNSKLCTPRSDMCSCVGNNLSINLGAAFQSPTYHNISDPNDPDGAFSFVISPCVDIDCGGKKARACEYDVKNDVFVVLGTAASVNWFVTDQNNYVVTYQGGDPTFDGKPRAASITGLIRDIRTPSYTYDGEDSLDTQLIYKFMVTYNNSKLCTSSSDMCSCVGNNLFINLGAAFQSPTFRNISDPKGPFYYIVSPCVDFDCGGRKSRVCQYYIKENAYVVLGSGDSGLVTWNVTDSNNFIVTYRGGDKTYDGKERETVIFGMIRDVETASYTYNGEEMGSRIVFYKFGVIYNNQAPACTILGVDMQSSIIVAAIGMLLCIVTIILATVMLVTVFVYKRKVKSIKYTHIQDKN